jgi:hypothetical protein
LYQGSGEKLGSAGAMKRATTWSSATEMQRAMAILQAIIMSIEITTGLAETMKSTIRLNREEETKDGIVNKLTAKLLATKRAESMQKRLQSNGCQKMEQISLN